MTAGDHDRVTAFYEQQGIDAFPTGASRPG